LPGSLTQLNEGSGSNIKKFTDRKYKNWILRMESIKTGVYRWKVGKLGLTDRE